MQTLFIEKYAFKGWGRAVTAHKGINYS